MFLGVDWDKSGRIGFFGSSGGTSGFGFQTGTVPTRLGRLASISLYGFAVIGPRVDCWHLFAPTVLTSYRQNFAFGMLLKVRTRRRRRFDKGVELSIAGLLRKKFVSFPPKDEVVRMRSTLQPSALTARRLLECNQPCTDRKFHVALKQRKALNVVVKPTRSYQSRRRSLHAMQQINAAICLISMRESASARSWFLHQRKLEVGVKLWDCARDRRRSQTIVYVQPTMYRQEVSHSAQTMNAFSTSE